MSINDILELARAGYTKEDITKLAAAGQAETKTETKEPEAAAAQPDAQPADYGKALEGINSAIAELTKQLQAGAIGQSQQPAKQSVDEILASIINPE